MGSIPLGTPGTDSARRKLAKNARSTVLLPVGAYSAREVKKLLQSQPARSREGQSI